MGNIRSFRELKVWQKAMDVAMHVFALSQKFPVEERYSLTDQVRRSSRSVRYPAAFVSKLNDAEGEAAETQTHIELTLRCRYLTDDQAKALDQACEEVLAMLTEMAAHPEQWTIRR
jgi:four helix bundle protein